jgi:hypothetical protein
LDRQGPEETFAAQAAGRRKTWADPAARLKD